MDRAHGDWQEQLVRKIEMQVHISVSVRNAFLAVPRLIFVPEYYVQQGTRLEWTSTCAKEDEVYDDRALVTQVDRHGMPSSSSSLPSLMALMLEALDLQGGQRVLEIGAGTGYNAALIAHIVKNPVDVTTIDIDPLLAQKAQQRLIHAGYDGIYVCAGNGLEGVPERAPYDRIIATGGFSTVPQAWMGQLSIGGKLIINLLFPLTHGIALLTKSPESNGNGHFLPLADVAFMQLREHVSDVQPLSGALNIAAYEQQPIQAQEIIYPGQLDITVFDDPAFLFYLQLECPNLEIRFIRKRLTNTAGASGTARCLLEKCSRASVQLSTKWDTQTHWEMVARGSYNLWECIRAAHKQWQQHRTPALDAYTIEVNTDGELSLLLGKKRWKMNSSINEM